MDPLHASPLINRELLRERVRAMIRGGYKYRDDDAVHRLVYINLYQPAQPIHPVQPVVVDREEYIDDDDDDDEGVTEQNEPDGTYNPNEDARDESESSDDVKEVAASEE